MTEMERTAAGTIYRLEEENRRLRAEACRYYRADGTFEVLDSPEEVVRRRVEAARQLEDRPRPGPFVRADLMANHGPPAEYADRINRKRDDHSITAEQAATLIDLYNRTWDAALPGAGTLITPDIVLPPGRVSTPDSQSEGNPGSDSQPTD